MNAFRAKTGKFRYFFFFGFCGRLAVKLLVVRLSRFLCLANDLVLVMRRSVDRVELEIFGR